MKIIRGQHFSEPPVVRSQSSIGAVYGFGYTYIPAGAPDLLNITELQSGNDNPLHKVALKHSDEIRSNYIGCATTRMPRTSDNDECPVECIHLIDGDSASCWLSKTQPRSSVNPVWIRIDLPIVQTCSRIVLRKLRKTPGRNWCYAWGPEDGAVEVGRGMPKCLLIETSTDGVKWDKVFEGETHDDDTKELFELPIPIRPVRMVRITGTQLVKVENLMFCFSIAEVEIYDAQDNNVALVSKGAGVCVNSTTHSQGQEMEVQRSLFPVHYDLGLKWVRVGYHDDVINWHWVEREKGILKIDKYADSTITELRDNGVEVFMCLNYGNRHYTERPERRLTQLWEFNYEPPLPPRGEEAVEAFQRYCRFMVRHFRDRVNYFEVWNEWNVNCYWCEPIDVDHFIKLAKLVIPIIREEAPTAKVVMGSSGRFLVGCHTWTKEEWKKNGANNEFTKAIASLAKDVDVIGFHPCYNTDPDTERMLHYEDDIKSFMSYCESCGFTGTYSVTEYNYGNCIPNYEGNMWWGDFSCTELEKAIYTARMIALHTRYKISSMFCETFNSTHPLDLSLFRRTVTQDPVDAQQPQAAYYVMRNLCTYFDGAEGCDGGMQIIGSNRKFVQTAYKRNGELIYGAWFAGRSKEAHAGENVDIRIDGEYPALVAYDPINGVEQELISHTEKGKTCVTGWNLREYPVFIRCKNERSL